MSRSLSIDPDSHSEGLVDERNVFSRINFPYSLWFTSRVWKVIGVPGLWVWVHIQKHDVAERFSPATIDVCCTLTQTSRILTLFWDSQGVQVLIFPPLSSIHSFNLPQPIGDRQTGRGRRPNAVRNQQTSPKTVQRISTQQNTRRHRAETERGRK